MWVQVLGPLAVHGTRGEVPVRRAGHRQLLCRLAVDAGRTVSTDRLVADLWGADPPRAARKSVQVYVSEIRRLLADDRGLLDSDAGGYRLDLAPTAVDAGRFEQQVNEAIGRLTADPARAATLLRDAASLWRGPAFADVADHDWGRAAATRLEELRLTAVERRIDADLAVGRHGADAAELAELVRHHPLREGFRAQLMVVLFREGRQAEALQAYRDGVTILAEELGIDPSPTMADLERRVLQQDPTLLTGTPAGQTAPPDAGSTAAPSTEEDETTERRFVTVIAARLPAGSRVAGRELLTTHEVAVIDAADPLVVVVGAPVTHGDELSRALEVTARLRDLVGPEAFRAAVACGDVEVGVGGPIGARRVVADGPCVEEVRALLTRCPAGTVRLSAGAALAAARLPGIRVTPPSPTGSAPPDGVRDLLPGPSATEPDGAADPAWVPSDVTPFVGRQQELTLLSALWGLARDQRAPHLVTVIGEAGVGKSRLVAEWISRQVDDVTVLLGRSQAWGERPFAPLTQALQQLVAGSPADVDAIRLRRWLEDHDVPDHELVAARLGLLLDGPVADSTAIGDHRELFAAVEAVLTAAAAAHPTIVVIEDVHLAGRSVADALGWMAATRRAVPLLLLLTARPELHDRHPDWRRMTGRTTSIQLGELDAAAAADLAGALAADLPLRAEPPADRLRDTRRAQQVAWMRGVAGGNPLFLEQLGAWLAEGGATGDERGGPLPPSIRSLVAVRLDRLGPRARRVLQTAAVIGPTFDADTVDLLLAPDRVGATLDELVDRHVLVATDHRGRYAFRHALVGEVALAGIPDRRRTALHRRLAELLERRPVSAGTSSLLAHHWLAAGDVDRAMPHLVTATTAAEREWAFHDAVGLLDRAVALLEARVPEGEHDRRLQQLRLERATAAMRWMHRVLDWYRLEEEPGTRRPG